MILTTAAAAVITTAKVTGAAITAAKVVGASAAAYTIGKTTVVGISHGVEKLAKKVNRFMK